jgi:hypothetical protein
MTGALYQPNILSPNCAITSKMFKLKIYFFKKLFLEINLEG